MYTLKIGTPRGWRSHFKVAAGSFPSLDTIRGGHSFRIRYILSEDHIRVKSKIMRQLKNIEFRDFVRKNDAEMYQRYMIFGPFCNTFTSLFLT